MKLIYSPELNELLLELEYPREIWHHDRYGDYIYKCFNYGKKFNYFKYYRIGSL